MNQEAKVTLNAPELQKALEIANFRRTSAIKKGRRPGYGAPIAHQEALDLDIMGAEGEAAVAKHFDIAWDGNGIKMKMPDVGPYDVRTVSKRHYNLLLNDRDNDDRAFILVWNDRPNYYLLGWLFARDGKKQEYWKTTTGIRKAYVYPQKLLNPMSTIPKGEIK